MKMFYKIFISCIFLWIGNFVTPKRASYRSYFQEIRQRRTSHSVVLLKGKTLHPYGLSLFHSISITDRPDDVTLFEACGFYRQPESRKQRNRKNRGIIPLPDITSYHLPSPMEKNRFILFRKTSPHDATLIYLEGQTH